MHTFDSSDEAFFRHFVEVGRAAYQRRPLLVAPFEAATAEALSPQRTFHPKARWKLFVEPEGARVAAIINPDVSEDERPVGQLGFFEMVDQGSADQLLEAALRWLSEQGVAKVVAPMEFDIYGRYRFKTKHFDEAPYYGEPQNAPEYPALFERLGFTARRRWYSVETPTGVTARFLGPLLSRAKGAPRFRCFRKEAFDEELRLLYELLTDTFTRFDLFSKLDWPAFHRAFKGLERIYDPSLVLFALDEGDAPVGFCVCLPDVAPRLRALRGHTDFLAMARYFFASFSSLPRCVVPYIGARRRAGGLGLHLAYATDLNAAKHGYRSLVHALMREDNPSRNYTPPEAREVGEYTLFERSLG